MDVYAEKQADSMLWEQEKQWRLDTIHKWQVTAQHRLMLQY
jgi:hypothetical protein